MALARLRSLRHAGRVDGHERQAVALEAHVHAVARGARHFADDHPFALGQAVDERALAGVAAADDRQFQGRVLRRLLQRFGRRQPLGDEVEQLVAAAVLQGADADQLAAAELVELGRLRFEGRRVALVGDANDRFCHITQTAGHFLVQRRRAGAGVHDEQEDVGLVDGGLDLAFDVLGEVVHVGVAHAAGVHQFDEAVADLQQRGHAVARHAGGRLDDGDAPAGQPVEQRRFADVGPSDDGHDRYSHVPILRNPCSRRRGAILSFYRIGGHRGGFSASGRRKPAGVA